MPLEGLVWGGGCFFFFQTNYSAESHGSLTGQPGPTSSLLATSLHSNKRLRHRIIQKGRQDDFKSQAE